MFYNFIYQSTGPASKQHITIQDAVTKIK